MGIFDRKRNIFDRQPKGDDPADPTWEGKRMRDAMTDARELDVKDAHSWNPETHPNGEGSSFLVSDIHYDPATAKLTVKYRDGFTAEYDGITTEQAKDFVTSSSKGRWAHKNLWPRPYRKA